jgi:hypothetical protein
MSRTGVAWGGVDLLDSGVATQGQGQRVLSPAGADNKDAQVFGHGRTAYR